MEFQTRNEKGELKYFSNFAGAVIESKRDRTVWKLSFTVDDVHYRWRPKTKSDPWSPTTEAKLCELSTGYKNEPANSKVVYWVHQAVLAPNRVKIYEQYADADDDQVEDALALDCILAIVTEEDFVEEFS